MCRISRSIRIVHAKRRFRKLRPNRGGMSCFPDRRSPQSDLVARSAISVAFNLSYSLPTMRFRPTISLEQYRDACLAVAAAKAKGVRKRSWKGMVGLGLACLAIGLSPSNPGS